MRFLREQIERLHARAGNAKARYFAELDQAAANQRTERSRQDQLIADSLAKGEALHTQQERTLASQRQNGSIFGQKSAARSEAFHTEARRTLEREIDLITPPRPSPREQSRTPQAVDSPALHFSRTDERPLSFSERLEMEVNAEQRVESAPAVTSPRKANVHSAPIAPESVEIEPSISWEMLEKVFGREDEYAPSAFVNMSPSPDEYRRLSENGRVELWTRPADLWFNVGNVVPHDWIKVPGLEAGLGPRGGGVPGQETRSEDMIPFYTQTEVINHAGQSESPEASGRQIQGIDEICVRNELELGKSQGRWTPLNTCLTFARKVIEKCRSPAATGPARQNEKTTE
jgi:hypothetical protein